MHWSIFFANCLWEWDTYWIPWVHQWAVLQLLLYGHHQYWYNFWFCNNYTYKHKLKCHFISEFTMPPLVKQNINIYIHAITKQSTKLLYSLWPTHSFNAIHISWTDIIHGTTVQIHDFYHCSHLRFRMKQVYKKYVAKLLATLTVISF